MNQRRPFDPAKVPFYYGWVILVVGSIGVLASVPGQTAGVSVFTDHLASATGLSRLQLSIAYLGGTGVSGLLLPIGGRWVDTHGSRRVAFGASLGLAATLTGLSFVGPMSTGVGLGVMTVGFGFLRFSGQGLLTLSSRTMVSQWFEARRGLISALSNSVVSFAFSITPAMLFALVQLSGFRVAWRQMAIILVVVFGFIVLVFYRDTPEASGIEIDGGAARPKHTDTRSQFDVPSVTRAIALRDIRFWVLALPVATQAAVTTALTFHIIDFGHQVGMGETTVLKIFLPIALVSVPISILTGWAVDHYSPIYVALVMAVAQILMYVTVFEIGNSTWLVVAIAAWGITSGCLAPLTSSAIPRLFGRTHLGAIGGAQMSGSVFGSAIGPAFFATINQLTGSYRAALLWMTILPLIGFALAIVSLRTTSDDLST